jgi:phosphoribosylanthranilate isomerase
MLRLVTAPALFRVKICGVTSAGDAALVAAAGADAIGLNFYPPSPRALTPEKALEVAAAIPSGVMRVGVFVNAAADVIRAHADALKLDMVQLHGDEPAEFLPSLKGLRVVKAFRVEGDGAAIDDFLKRANDLGCPPEAILLDAAKTREYGGSGVLSDWNLAAAKGEVWPPLILAGGLTPVNVAAAILTARPAAVDTASGVESSKGIKDPALSKQFVTNARRAFRSRASNPDEHELAEEMMAELRVREEAHARQEQAREKELLEREARIRAQVEELAHRERQIGEREEELRRRSDS